ncbi:TPD sequence-motif-containing protein [Nitzschia inconspicua]|uniref:CDAN1-interacting nuclease 1 n=1 Tax=Nitzschia inconspicua TaxID=303405 RepID=A0A9K3P7V5_9STRA|nr:TPD sequence-motif-containing protein [Nitzschia inconspicua]KAG7360329.1 TPD sequence-motif-containing protein [Nitzschia inconspicua]
MSPPTETIATFSTAENDEENKQRYDQVEQWCRHEIAAGSDFLFDSIAFEATMKRTSRDLQFPLESLQSFFRNIYVQHIKSRSFQVKSQCNNYVEQYRKGSSILQLAQTANFSPYLMARVIVENVAIIPDDKKKFLTAAMRDPMHYLGRVDCVRDEFLDIEHQWATEEKERISSATAPTRLATEVNEAIDSDPLSGPRSDRAKHFVGIEFEVALEHMLRTRGIPFESETQLREKGTSKTPDVLLSCPIGVEVGSQWRIVNWIDSKALFGDVGTHQQSVLPQCDSYINRFGPGMILYFFGHAPISLLGDANGDLVIMGWELPKRFMWPTGSISDNS